MRKYKMSCHFSDQKALKFLLACMIYLWLSWRCRISLHLPTQECNADAASRLRESR